MVAPTRLARLALALAATALPSLPAGEPDPQAYAESVAALMREGGFTEVTTIKGTFKKPEDYAKIHRLDLAAGQRLIVFACGDAKAIDLDLSVSGPDGQEWDDTLTDARPLVELTASVAGTYRIDVLAHSIDGDSCSYILLHATRN